MIINAQPLTPDAFMPFGDVLMGFDENRGPERHEFAAHFQKLHSNARPNLTFMRVPVEGGDIVVRVLERHRFSNQVFVPMNGTRQLVATCPSLSNGTPDLAGLCAFVASGHQAINYGAAVWHAPRIALCRPGEFVMFRWDDGSSADTETLILDREITIKLGDLA